MQDKLNGKNNLNLLDKMYVVSGLDLPNGFNITGTQILLD